MILFLHGSAERGNDLTKLLRTGLGAYREYHPDLPFIILSPQCPTRQWWSAPKLKDLVDNAIGAYRVDPNCIYATGVSMGGYGSYELAAAYPDLFAAAAPMAGAANPLDAQRLKKIPIWPFHGSADESVPLDSDQRGIDALIKAGGRVKFTVYPGVGHDCWTQSYANPDLYQWFLAQSLGKPAPSQAK